MNAHIPEQESKPLAVHIIINARPREVTGERVTYTEVVELAFPGVSDTGDTLYSVHYTGPHLPDGTLAEGQSVQLENGMKFDVSKTNRS